MDHNARGHLRGRGRQGGVSASPQVSTLRAVLINYFLESSIFTAVPLSAEVLVRVSSPWRLLRGWLSLFRVHIQVHLQFSADQLRALILLAPRRTMTPPRLSPSKELLEAPIWTTWARYFSRVNQAKVLKYAHEIVSRGLQVCLMLPP